MVRKARKRLVFSGAPSTDTGALDASLTRAAGVRVTRHGYLIYAVDEDADVLAADTPKYVSLVEQDPIAVVDDPHDVQSLRQALGVSEVTGSICMCTGDFALEFVDADGECVDIVRVDLPDAVEWRLWQGRARLAHPDSLSSWLAARGIATSPK